MLVFTYDTGSWKIRLITSKWILNGQQSVTRMCTFPEDTDETVSPCIKQSPAAIAPKLPATIPLCRCLNEARDKKTENVKFCCVSCGTSTLERLSKFVWRLVACIFEVKPSKIYVGAGKVALNQVSPPSTSAFSCLLSFHRRSILSGTWIMAPTTHRRNSLSPYHGK